MTDGSRSTRVPNGTELSSAQYQRLRQVLVTMPHSAALENPDGKLFADPARTRLDVDYLTDWLNALRDVIAKAATDTEDTERQLREIVGQRDAMRAFLGLQ